MTGISVGDYRDPERGLELGELLVEAARVPGVERVRLSSVEVIHVRDSLVEALRRRAEGLPPPARPDAVGRRRGAPAMGRHYTAGEYLAAIATLRAAVPHVNVTTDVIVGFPTEDERGLPADAHGDRGGGHHPRAHLLLLAAPRHAGRASSATASRRRRRSAAPRRCAGSPRSARATTATASSGDP